MDLVLGEPQADGLLALERVHADEDLGGGEGLTTTGADDQDCRFEIGPLGAAFRELTVRILVPRVYGHIAFPGGRGSADLRSVLEGISWCRPAEAKVFDAVPESSLGRPNFTAATPAILAIRCPNHAAEGVHAPASVCSTSGRRFRKAARVRPSAARRGQGSTPAAVAARKTAAASYRPLVGKKPSSIPSRARGFDPEGTP